MNDYSYLKNNYFFLLTQSKNVKNKMKRFFLFGTPIVIFRDAEKKLSGFIDACPHRGVPLSNGYLSKDSIQCPYHGWKFNHNGTCQKIPAQETHSAKLCLTAVAVQESRGFIFVNFNAQPGEKVEIPYFETHKSYYFNKSVKSDLVHLLENFLDATHTPYVHKYLIRSPETPQSINANIVRDGQSVNIIYTNEPKQSGLISKIFERERSHSSSHFQMPSTAEINFYSKNGLNLKIRIYHTPTEDDCIDMHIFIYFKKSFLSVLTYIKYLLIYPFFYIAFLQDKKIVEILNKNLKYFPYQKPILCESDLIRKHIHDLIVNQNFSKSDNYEMKILV